MQNVSTFLIVGALILAGLARTTDGVAGAVMVGTACLCGIFARIAQAANQHNRDYERTLARERRFNDMLRSLLRNPRETTLFKQA